jgi:ABC-type Fe3+-hydroxamate transport system substrate-binding protein
VITRIVSLVPSVTETLFELGCGARVVGCTTFCAHPKDAVSGIPKVGGTKDPDVAGIIALRPDLVLANREENREEDVLSLRRAVPVHVSYPRDLPDLFGYLRDLGALLGAEGAAAAMIRSIEDARARCVPPARKPRVAYLIWRHPWMAAGPDTFVDAMLRACGFENAVVAGGGRYPEVDLAALGARVDAFLLSSEPFPFGERHRDEVARAAARDPSRALLVSGEAFSWFGCRTKDAFAEAARVHAALSG